MPCLTIDLPVVAAYGYEDGADYVYPPGAKADEDPATWSYEFAPNLGECWSAGIDTWPPTSGAEFIFCPAGAVSGVEWVDADDTSVDRVYMTQGETSFYFVREDA